MWRFKQVPACHFCIGSGKTHTMFGKEAGEHDREARGLIPRAAEGLFASVAEAHKRGSSARYVVFVSLLEVFLEQVRDLGFIVQNGGRGGGGASESQRRSSYPKADHTNLEIYEDASGATLVKDLTYIEVKGAAEVLDIVKAAAAAACQNDTSSRSHTVFTFSVVQYRDNQKPSTGMRYE